MNLLRTVDRPGEIRPDILLIPGVNSVLPWVYAPVRILRPSGGGALADVTRLYFGNGALPSTASAPDVAIGDFNRDGKADFFIAESGWDAVDFPGSPERGAVNVLLQSTDGGSYVDLSSTLPDARAGTFGATTADVDGDGFLDIFVVELEPAPSDAPAHLLMGRADGTFDHVSSTLPVWLADKIKWKYNFLAATFVDVDNDGYPDLVLGRSKGSPFPTESRVLLNDGNGDFSHRAPVMLPAGAFGNDTTTWKMAAIDANGDGYQDLLLVTSRIGQAGPDGHTGPVEAQIQLLINRGDGTFVDETLARLGPRSTDPNGYGWDGVIVTDLNGDGDIAYQTFINTAVRTVPSEPVTGIAVAGDAQATVAFAPPLHAGASAITGYTVTCRGGSGGGPVVATGAGSPITVTGLVNALPYFCTVVATNAQGTSMPSARSNLVRPRGALAVAITGNGVSLFSEGVVLTATLSGVASATGTVNFRSFGATIPGCGNQPVVANVATCATKALAYGPNRIDAIYSGDAGNRATAAPAVSHSITGGGVDVTGLIMPTVAAGSTRTVCTEIRNVGNAPLDLTGLSFTGPFAPTYNTCGPTLAPEQSCTVNVAYSSTATSGPITGTIEVTHSGYNSPFVATLQGQGTALAAPARGESPLEADTRGAHGRIGARRSSGRRAEGPVRRRAARWLRAARWSPPARGR